MVLSVYHRYEIIFLSQHSLGPKLSHTPVAKAIHCGLTTVKYWLKRWKQSKDLSDANRSDRPRATTQKQNQQILSLTEQQTFVTSRDITNKINKKGVKIDERTVRRRLNEAGAKYTQPLLKPLLTEGHRKKQLK
jgi:transposase